MNNLVLVGFSCSGKTTIGRTLARRLRLHFVDTDRLIETTVGRTIPDIFRDDGEPAFRALERQAVAEACCGSDRVISTGGGAFVDPENRTHLKEGNLVIHLQVRPETVVDRLRNSRSGRPRPLLEAPDPIQRVKELMESRRAAYTDAHVTLVVDGRSTYEVVREIARRWQARQRQRQAPEGLLSRGTAQAG